METDRILSHYISGDLEKDRLITIITEGISYLGLILHKSKKFNSEEVRHVADIQAALRDADEGQKQNHSFLTDQEQLLVTECRELLNRWLTARSVTSAETI